MVQIRQVGPQIGFEITGIDVATMDEATWHKIYLARPQMDAGLPPDRPYPSGD